MVKEDNYKYLPLYTINEQIREEWHLEGIKDIKDTNGNVINYSIKEFVRLLRNGLAHGNIKYSLHGDKYLIEIWNINHRIEDMRVIFSIEQLYSFSKKLATEVIKNRDNPPTN